MSESSTNPFVLPGMGQASDLSGNPLLASMEMMRQAWAGLAGPGGLAQSLPMTPPLNTEELERRIADLRAVEGWLRMNLAMLGSTIQGLEVQRATIATLRSFVDSAASANAGAAAPGGPSPLEVVLGLKPAPGQSAGAGPAAGDTEAAAHPNQAGAQAEAGADLNDAARSASQAWWDMLQQQFTHIAAATAASMGAANAAGATPAAPSSGQSASGQAAGADAPRQGKPAAASGKAAAREPAARPARKRAAPRKTGVRRTPPGSSS